MRERFRVIEGITDADKDTIYTRLSKSLNLPKGKDDLLAFVNDLCYDRSPGHIHRIDCLSKENEYKNFRIFDQNTLPDINNYDCFFNSKESENKILSSFPHKFVHYNLLGLLLEIANNSYKYIITENLVGTQMVDILSTFEHLCQHKSIARNDFINQQHEAVKRLAPENNSEVTSMHFNGLIEEIMPSYAYRTTSVDIAHSLIENSCIYLDSKALRANIIRNSSINTKEIILHHSLSNSNQALFCPIQNNDIYSSQINMSFSSAIERFKTKVIVENNNFYSTIIKISDIARLNPLQMNSEIEFVNCHFDSSITRNDATKLKTAFRNCTFSHKGTKFEIEKLG